MVQCKSSEEELRKDIYRLERDPRDTVTKLYRPWLNPYWNKPTEKIKTGEIVSILVSDESMVVTFMFKQDNLIIFEAGQLAHEG